MLNRIGWTTAQHAEMAFEKNESQKALAEHLLHNSVVPIAFGTFEPDTKKSFFLNDMP